MKVPLLLHLEQVSSATGHNKWAQTGNYTYECQEDKVQLIHRVIVGTIENKREWSCYHSLDTVLVGGNTQLISKILDLMQENWRDSTMGRALTLHVTKPGSNANMTYDPLHTVKNNS